MAARHHDFSTLFKNIEVKTQVSLKQIIETAILENMAKGQVKANDFYSWLNTKYGIGRGGAQAIWINFDEIAKSDKLN